MDVCSVVTQKIVGGFIDSLYQKPTTLLLTVAGARQCWQAHGYTKPIKKSSDRKVSLALIGFE